MVYQGGRGNGLTLMELILVVLVCLGTIWQTDSRVDARNIRHLEGKARRSDKADRFDVKTEQLNLTDLVQIVYKHCYDKKLPNAETLSCIKITKSVFYSGCLKRGPKRIRHSVHKHKRHSKSRKREQNHECMMSRFLACFVRLTEARAEPSPIRMRSGQEHYPGVLDTSDDAYFRNDTRICLLKDTRLKKYYVDKSICCGGELLPNPITDPACIDDLAVSLCRGCCHNVVYDRATQWCYNDQLYDKGQKGDTHKLQNVTSNEIDDKGAVADDNGKDGHEDEYTISKNTHGTRDETDDKVLDDDNGDDGEDEKSKSHTTTIILGSSLPAICFIVFVVFLVWRWRDSKPNLFCSMPLKNETDFGEDRADKPHERTIHDDKHTNIDEVTITPIPELPKTSHTVDTAIMTDHCSLHSELTLKLIDLPVTDLTTFENKVLIMEELDALVSKTGVTCDKNMTQSQWKTTETQTETLKESNLRDSLGRPFQGCFLSHRDDRVVQLAHSDVVMTLPKRDLQEHPIECHASSLTNITSLRKKFKLAKQECIASPVFEALLRGVHTLKDHAVVKLPICAHSDKIRILRAESDFGTSQIFEEIYDVPRMNTKQEGMNLDTFYVLSENRQYVLIYTRLFSVYICVDCGDESNVEAKAYTYAGVKRGSSKKVFLMMELVIAGQLSRFRDYREKITCDQEMVGRKLVEIKDMRFKKELCSTDCIEVHMAIQDIDDWDFVRPPGVQSSKAEKQTFQANQMMQCQCKNGMPFITLSWEIENKTSRIPECFQGYVTILHKQPESTDGQTTAAGGGGPPESNGDSVCQFALLEQTKRSRRRGSGSFSSNSYSHRNSMESHEQVSIHEQKHRGSDGAVVRKELDDSMLTHKSPPRRELLKKPECSFDILGNRAVSEPEVK